MCGGTEPKEAGWGQCSLAMAMREAKPELVGERHRLFKGMAALIRPRRRLRPQTGSISAATMAMAPCPGRSAEAARSTVFGRPDASWEPGEEEPEWTCSALTHRGSFRNMRC